MTSKLSLEACKSSAKQCYLVHSKICESVRLLFVESDLPERYILSVILKFGNSFSFLILTEKQTHQNSLLHFSCNWGKELSFLKDVGIYKYWSTSELGDMVTSMVKENLNNKRSLILHREKDRLVLLKHYEEKCLHTEQWDYSLFCYFNCTL